MVKLLVIADDFTGALDTGVQFRAKGTVLRFGAEKRNFFDGLEDTVNVLIVDTETRHLPPAQAAEIVRYVVEDAVRAGVQCIYKKTDSGLRGNIGSELTAALEASGWPCLHFIPAYPQMGRTTREGIHYIGGVPVAESVFGADPFEPVRFSSVAEMIASQSSTAVTLVKEGQIPREGIALYDAQSEEDLRAIARQLQQHRQLQLMAGCAGFAAVLPELLNLERAEGSLPAFSGRLLTVCGSINPITLGQLDAAEAAGVPRVRLNACQKLDRDWLPSPEGQAALAQWTALAQTHTSTIVECDGRGQPEQMEECRKALAMEPEQVRLQIAQTMGAILKNMLDSGLDATLLVTGGDTLLAFMKQIGQNELVPVCEFAPGVVLSRIRYRGRSYNLLSKSGGFGSADLLAKLEAAICARSGIEKE